MTVPPHDHTGPSAGGHLAAYANRPPSAAGLTNIKPSQITGGAVTDDDARLTDARATTGSGTPFQWVLRVSGALAVLTNVAEYFRVPANVSITEVQCHVLTAPLLAAVIIDVNDDGTTVFTTQGNRPSIAAGANDDTSGTPDGGTSIAKDSVITVDVDQVGIGTTGAGLTIHLRGVYL